MTLRLTDSPSPTTMEPAGEGGGVAQKPIELILLRELARRLEFPVNIVDCQGRAVYFNEAAERLLGWRHEDTGEIPMAELAERLAPLDEDGAPIPADQLPIGVALRERRPQQGRLCVHHADGTPRWITTTSVPLDGQGGTLLGAMAIFWESDGP